MYGGRFRVPFVSQCLDRISPGRLGVTGDNSQQNAGSAIWNTASLFPVLHGTDIETESIRELLATQLHALAQRKNVLCGRIIDNLARQNRLAAHVGKNLAQGCFHFASYLGSFRCHRLVYFLIDEQSVIENIR